MLYKEWKSVRVKFWLWLLIYGGAGVLQLLTWSPGSARLDVMTDTYNNPLIQTWLTLGLIITMVVATLGGVDLVSEEVNQSTLSFLLTRPISRTRIYVSKVGLNVAALTIIYGLVSLGLVLFDQFFSPRLPVARFGEGITESTQPVALSQSLAFIGLTMLIGIIIICVSGLISVLTRTLMQSLALTLPTLLVLGLAIFAFSFRQGIFWLGIVLWPMTVVLAGLLFTLAGLFFCTGLVIFKRKEF